MYHNFLLVLTFLVCGFESSQLPHNPDIPEITVFTKAVTIDSTYLATRTFYFNVDNDSLYGAGGEVWDKIIKESQFIVFGERHNSKETSKLVSALIPKMSAHGYSAMGLEVGPNGTEKLKQLMVPYHNTIQNLKDFNTKYYKEQVQSTPMVFFSGVEDAEFLAKASKYKFDLFGLDQEHYYSIFFLTDEILAQTKSATNYSEIKVLKDKADQVILEKFIEETESEEEVDLFRNILKNPDVQNFFTTADSASSKSAKIISDLKISWDIYSRWRNDSHADRISYIRNNFFNYHQQNKTSKIFVKVGQVHASQIITKGTYDIGHFAEELAQNKNKKCTNINSWTKYYLEDGKEEDYKDWYTREKLFIQFARKDKWTIIDLESIRDDIEQGKVKLPTNGDFHSLNALIQGYDYQLILPQDEYITVNIELE